MKKAAITASLLVILCGGLLVYGLIRSRLYIVPQPVLVVAASDQPDEFRRLQSAVAKNTFIGTAFVQEVPGAAQSYQLVVYTVLLHNRGLVSAKMAELMISPAKDDLLCYTDGSAQGTIPSITIPPEEKQVSGASLLTRVQTRLNTVREGFVSYYLWGNPFIVKVTFG